MSEVRVTRYSRRPAPAQPGRFVLSHDEVDCVEALVGTLAARFDSVESAGFLEGAEVSAHDLPRRLREFLAHMKTAEPDAACVVSGFVVDDDLIGPTIKGWQAPPAPGSSTRREQIWLVLCGSLLGDVFGWATQQNGALVHDIAPKAGHEHTQLGTGSSEVLLWHTEEAFHPLKCDYLGLLCLRNHDAIPTTVASIDDVRLDADTLRVLFEPRYVIRPDDSHLSNDGPARSAGPKERRLQEEARERIDDMQRHPERAGVLHGDPDSPYLSIDPFYMQVPEQDDEAQAALDALCAALDACLVEVALAPGEILFIDNYRAVHGRQAFQAMYDGTDRWLKRVNITRDLRKSRAHRMTSESRVVH